MKKKILALGLAVLTLVGTVTVSAAENQVLTGVTYTGNEMKTDKEDATNKNSFEGIAPGEARQKVVTIKNTSENTADFYIAQSTVSSLEEVANASGAAYTFTVKVGDDFATATTLLDGQAGGFTPAGEGSANGLKELTDLNGYTFLVQLAPGESTKLFMELFINGEGNDNDNETKINDYSNAAGSINLSFRAQDLTRRTITKQGEPVVRYNPITQIVQTGDATNILLYVGILVVGIILLVVFLLLRKKDKKEDVKKVSAIALLIVMAGVTFFGQSNLVYASEYESSTEEKAEDADNLQKAYADKKYTITIRSGNVGEFIPSRFVGEGVEATADYVKLKADRGEKLSDVLAYAFGKEGLEDYNPANELLQSVVTENYVVDADAINLEDTVSRNKEYVMNYSPVGDAIKYTVRYVDIETNEQIAPATVVYMNRSDVTAETILTASKIIVKDYACNTPEVKFVPSLTEENVITYFYNFGAYEIVIVEGQVTYIDVVTQQVVPAPAPAVQGGQAVEEPAAENPANIDDEQAPQAAGDDTTADDENTVIEDEEAPLAPGEMKPWYEQPIILGSGIALIAFAILGGTAIMIRKRNIV